MAIVCNCVCVTQVCYHDVTIQEVSEASKWLEANRAEIKGVVVPQILKSLPRHKPKTLVQRRSLGQKRFTKPGLPTTHPPPHTNF